MKFPIGQRMLLSPHKEAIFCTTEGEIFDSTYSALKKQLQPLNKKPIPLSLIIYKSGEIVYFGTKTGKKHFNKVKHIFDFNLSRGL